VPAGTDVREIVRSWDKAPPREHTAVLRVRSGSGHSLRRYALDERQDAPGWDLVTVAYSGPGWYAEHLASFGADVVVIEPPDLREAVIRKLKGVLA
jgi:predicted DNA-binding transcriptional regulator YafY